MKEGEKDRFGFPKMSINQEVAASFTLFVLGTLIVVAVLYPLSQAFEIKEVFLGLIMMATGYLFAIESIRELEEKDHYLSRKLEKSE